MNWRLFFIIIFTVFLAELGDKTQLAILSYTSTDPKNRWIIFLGGSIALVMSTFIAVFLGGALSRFINPFWLQFIAALLLITLGMFLLIQSFREKEAYKVINNDLETALETECITCPHFWDMMQHFQQQHHQRLSSHILQHLEKRHLINVRDEPPASCYKYCRVKEVHKKFHETTKGGPHVEKPGSKDTA